MIREMQDILRKNNQLTEYDLQDAGAVLLAFQCLYRFEARDRDHYLIISEYRKEFRSLFDTLGFEMETDDTFSYVAIKPRRRYRKIKKEATLMILVLRHFYEEEMRQFKSEEGIVSASRDEILTRYKILTGTDGPKSLAQFDALIRDISRYGIIRLNTQLGDESGIKIYPGIQYLINEDTLKQLTDHNNVPREVVVSESIEDEYDD